MAETGAEAPYAAQVKPDVVNRIAMNARRMSFAFHQRQSTNSKRGVRCVSTLCLFLPTELSGEVRFRFRMSHLGSP